MSSTERTHFNAALAMEKFLSLARTTSKVNCTELTTLETLVKKSKLSDSDRVKILDTLACLICEDELTDHVAFAFQPILLDLLWRAKVQQPKATLFVAVSKLIGYHETATDFWYHYSKSESVFKLPLKEYQSNPVVKKRRSSESDVSVLRACVSCIWLNTSWFVHNCNWSVIVGYACHSDPELRWLAMQCVRLISGTSEAHFNEALKNSFSVEEVLSLRLKFSSLFKARNKVVVQDETSEVHTKLDLVFGQKDFSSNLVSVCDILLHKAGDKTDSVLQHDIVLVPSFEKCLRRLTAAVSVNQPTLIQGPVGSGKSSLVEYLASQTGRTRPPSLTKIQLGDQIDSKLLIGTHCCTEIPGDFVWRAGPLTHAMINGHWLLVEDIDCASPDVVTILIAAIKSRSLSSLPGASTSGSAHPDFRIFFTRRLLGNNSEFMNRAVQSELEKICTRISMPELTREELHSIVDINWPILKPILPRLLDSFITLTSRSHSFDENSTGHINARIVSLRDLIKWCQRLQFYFKINSNQSANFAFMDAADCFYQSFADVNSRITRGEALGVHLNVSKREAEHLICSHKPEVKITSTKLIVGRTQLDRKIVSTLVRDDKRVCFAYTQQAVAMLEKICVAVAANEPVLLVGETGTGKTSTVQYIASTLCHHLTVVNMNQQSDSCDLLGGYKPVDFGVIVQPLRREFEDLFSRSFSPEENSKFLSHVNSCYQKKRWDDLFSLMLHVVKSAQKKKNSSMLIEWKELGARVKELKLKCKLDEKNYLVAFAYIEGSLVKALKEGSWILLDEINLAEAETLQCLSSALDSQNGSVVLLDKADGKPVDRHPDFRLFACMNPATDVGKKELTLGIRNRFTELYVDELESEPDLQILVSSYLSRIGVPATTVHKIVKFYLKAKEVARTTLCDTTGHKPHYSLRTLCRALSVAASNPCAVVSRSLYESFCLSFLTQLDLNSRTLAEKLISDMLLGEPNALSIKGLDIPQPQSFASKTFEGYWVPLGDKEPFVDPQYILTPSVHKNLKDLARIISIGKSFPVLIQGETSVGKTSLIQWLASATGNICVRVNNHEHTDLQEYVGSYCSDSAGQLVFKEGLLVEAMRNGYWIILDELNLAPTEVLEALNRVLDDNRELFITETQTTVKAHPRFLLFATQNPPGHYGGRKILSRAFRNRFVELHFDEIPHVELIDILYRRCKLPISYAKKMINVLTDLQLQRRETGVFAGKQGFITLRDLFRWGERYRIFSDTIQETFFDWETYVAIQGYMVIAGRVRKQEEVEVVKQILEKKFKRKLNVAAYIDNCVSDVLGAAELPLKSLPGFKHLVLTAELKRLVAFLWESLKYEEPVLLVGETGCGKTTACQLYSVLKKLQLYSINCHMHSESADFLGSLRPVRNKSDNSDKLFEWVDGPLIDAMKGGGVFLADEISLADDSVLERLNSVLEPERSLLLAEKSIDGEGSDGAIIKAAPSFRLVATMNPGGDYGKKELSPALRNRFTEIWCPITSDIGDIAAIIKHNLNVTESEKTKISKVMCDFYSWFRDEISAKKNVSSVRDILAWTQFVNKVTSDSVARKLNIGEALVNGGQLVFVDAVGCGGFIASDQALKAKQIGHKCLSYLKNLVSNHISCPKEKEEIMQVDGFFGIDPFYVEVSTTDFIPKIDFTFTAKGVIANCVKVLRAMQLTKPILLEGIPGVGKTSLVQALAKVTGRDIVRINLSEQTDISDLFGGDLPVDDDSTAGSFSWRDGPLLEALKSPKCWIILDELNLASQSVLEGLNACLDHRGEIFVAELGKTFKVNKNNTRIFACQNPYGQGGARKGLPKSFLNRFTVCYIDAFTDEDLEFIVCQMFPTLPLTLVSKMVHVTQAIVKQIDLGNLGRHGAPWELNLRDIFRWAELLVDYYASNTNQIDCSLFAKIILVDRFRSNDDKELVSKIFEGVFEQPIPNPPVKVHVYPSVVQVGHQSLVRQASNLDPNNYDLLHSELHAMESLVTCINMKWLAILVGPTAVGKSTMVHQLARLCGRKLSSLTVSSEMDTIELLGGFEKKDFMRHYFLLQQKMLEELKAQIRISVRKEMYSRCSELSKSWHDYQQSVREQADTDEVTQFLTNLEALNVVAVNLKKYNSGLALSTEIEKLGEKVSKCKSLNGGGNFEWIDSQLVNAIKNGDWLLIDDVNLCSSSVLDRLNGLLEPRGTLSMTEQGVVNGQIPVIVPHENFRLIMTMDPRNGELSRAMRNRGIEICMLEITSERDFHILLKKCGVEDASRRTVLIGFHQSISKHPKFEFHNFSISHLMQAASLLVNVNYSENLVVVLVEVYGQNTTEQPEAVVREILQSLPNSESCFIFAPDLRYCLGDSLVSKCEQDCEAIALTEKELDSATHEFLATGLQVYLERQSKEDYSLRKCFLSRFNENTQLFEAFDVHAALKVLGLISLQSLTKFEEQPIDFRGNRQVWDKFWAQDTDYDKQNQVVRCLNQYLLSLHWLKLKFLLERNSCQESALVVSKKFNEKKLSKSQLPVTFVKHVQELVETIENKLVSSSLTLTANDEDYFAMQEMLAWIYDLLCFCYGKECTKKQADALYDKFVVLWTMTNQFSINKLRSHFEIDIGHLIDQVNESVHIDVIEHEKGWTKVISAMSCQVKFCDNQQSAESFLKLIELISLWSSFEEKIHQRELRIRLFSILTDLAANTATNGSSIELKSDLESLEADLRVALAAKCEDGAQEENDIELLEKIKKRKLISSNEILPLWQLFFTLSEKKKLMNLTGEGCSAKLLEKVVTLVNPFYEFYIRRGLVDCDRILFSNLDMFKQLEMNEICKLLNKKLLSNSDETNVWLEKGIQVDSSPLFTFAVSNLISTDNMKLGQMYDKQKQNLELLNFLWNNYTALSQVDSVNLLHHHRQVVSTFSSQLQKHCATLQQDKNKKLKLLLEKAQTLLADTNSNLSFGTAEVFVGQAAARLFAPFNTIDPVERRKCKLSHYESRLRLVEAQLLLQDALCVLETGEHSNVDFEHPHVAHYTKLKVDLEHKIEKLQRIKCFRPVPSQYLKLRNDVKKFLASQMGISEISEICKKASRTKGCGSRDGDKKILENVMRLEGSVSGFINHLQASYPLYTDVLNCFVCSLTLIKHGLRTLEHEVLTRVILADSKECVPRIVTRFCQDNLSIFTSNGLESSKSMKLRSTSLQSLLESLTLSAKYLNMLLKAELIDIQNALVLNRQRKEEDLRKLTNDILNRFISSWKVVEDENNAKKEAEEKLFEFKMRHHEAEPTEEQVDAIELARQFPSFSSDYTDIAAGGSAFDHFTLGDSDVTMGVEATVSQASCFLDDDKARLEVIAIHEQIVESLNSENGPGSSGSCTSRGPRLQDMKLMDSINLRYKVMTQLIEAHGPVLGKAGFAENDLMSVHIMQISQQAKAISSCKTSFNIYHDHNIDEMTACYQVLERIERRIIGDLLVQFPGHPTLTKLLQIIDRIFDFAVQSPLIRFVTGLELILETAQDWQQMAHKGIKLTDELNELTQLVISWRKLELKQWSTCLDSVVAKLEENEKSKWWFHFYYLLSQLFTEEESEMTEKRKENILSFIVSVKKFMESSSIGQYSVRLELLNSFAMHVKAMKGTSNCLYYALSNVSLFYGQFKEKVSQKVNSERAPLEKEVKEFVKVMRWNDINFWSVKNAVEKSHKTLLRYMKRTESALNQPVQPLLFVGSSELVRSASQEKWTFSIDHEKFLGRTRTSFSISDTNQLFISSLASSDTILSSAANFSRKMKRLSRTIISAASQSLAGAVSDVNDLAGDIIDEVKNLQSLQVPDDIKDKVEWKKKAHHIHNRKRKALADLFKKLAESGLSFRKGLVVDAVFDVDDAFLKTGPVADISDDVSSEQDVNAVNQYFMSCIARFSALRLSLHSPSKELNTANIERIKGFSGHLMATVVKQRQTLAEQSVLFNRVAEKANCLVTNEIPLARQTEAADWSARTSELAERTALTLLKSIEFMTCKPESCDEEMIMLSEHPTPLWNCEQLKKIALEYIPVLEEHLHSRQSRGLVFQSDLTKLERTFASLVSFAKEFGAFEKQSSTSMSSHPLFTALVELCSEIKESSELFAKCNGFQLDSRSGNIDLSHSCSVISHTMVCTENLLKHSTEHSQKVLNMKELADFALIWKAFKFNKFENLLCSFSSSLLLLCENGFTAEVNALIEVISPFVHYYLTLSEYYVKLAFASLRANSKTLHVLLGIFAELTSKGFCLPAEPQEDDGKQQGEQFKDISDGGLGEGDGTKDVSEKIESEDQLEDTLREGQEKEKQEEDDKEHKDEDNGVEMSEDFDGKSYDEPQGEDEDKDGEDSSDEKDDLDDQMGDLDGEDSQYDKKIWDDDGDDEEEDDMSDIENDGKGEDMGDDKMVANEENKGLNSEENAKEKKREDQEKEIDQVNEQQQEAEYDGEKEDPYKSQSNDDNKPDENEGLRELPEDLVLDAEEEGDGEKEDEEMPDESQETGAENEPEELNEVEPIDGETKENMPEPKESQQEEEEGDDKDIDGEGMENAARGEEEEQLEKDEEFAEDQNETEDSAAIPADSKTQRDNVQTAPERASKNEQQSDVPQNDHEDAEGVGEAQAGRDAEGHEGITRAETRIEDESSEKESYKPNKKAKDRRSLAKDEKKSAKRQKVLDKQDEDGGSDPKSTKREEGNQSQLYQHIDEHDVSDDEVIDTAAEEDAKQSRPNREDEQAGDKPDESLADKPEEMDVDEKLDQDLDKSLEAMKLRADSDKRREKEKRQLAPIKEDNVTEDGVDVDGDFAQTETVSRAPESSFHTQLEKVSTMADKDWIRRLAPVERSEISSRVSVADATKAWEECSAEVAPLVYELCEQLQLVLEPTKSSKLKGDYRTGKRINMRKVVAYIASQFRKDKIWMKRNKPSKRTYQIVLAVDDSLSMADNQSKKLAFESLALLSKSLSLLEAGDLGLMSFGEQVRLLHSLGEPFTDTVAARLLTDFTFDQKQTRIAALLETVSSLFISSRNSTSASNKDISQLLLIISDGRGVFNEGEQLVRQNIRRLRDCGVFIVFLVLDNPKNKDSIMDIKKASFGQGTVKFESYMETFPFPYYVILRNINQMPVVLGEALRQWFELVTSSDR